MAYRVRIFEKGATAPLERWSVNVAGDKEARDWHGRYWNAHFATGDLHRSKMYRRGERRPFDTIG